MVGPTGRGLWQGEKGASAFTEPFIDPELRPNQLPGFLQRIQNTGDERSFVIVSSVVVERYLDSLLGAIIPGYGGLAEKREVTFSLKLELLKALRLIPSHIVVAANLIRRVRNKFAHDLACDGLEQLDNGMRSDMAQTIRELFGDAEPYLSSTREMFKALTFFVLAGFAAYIPNLAVLRERLTDGTLGETLKKECEERHNAKIESITRKEPTKIVDKDGWRHKYYENGVVEIGPIDPDNAPTTLNLDPFV